MSLLCPECDGSGKSAIYICFMDEKGKLRVKKKKGICGTCNGLGVVSEEKFVEVMHFKPLP